MSESSFDRLPGDGRSNTDDPVCPEGSATVPSPQTSGQGQYHAIMYLMDGWIAWGYIVIYNNCNLSISQQMIVSLLVFHELNYL